MKKLFTSLLPKLKELANNFFASNYDEVKVLAQELISIAYQNKEADGYGLVLHIAHTYLGILAVMEDKHELAKKEMMESITVPNSNGVYGFGPNMLLCKLIIDRYGDFTSTKEYLHLSKKYSSFLARLLYINKISKDIRNSQVPDFGNNLYYHIFPEPKKLGRAKQKISEIEAFIQSRKQSM